MEVVSFMPQPLYTKGKNLSTHWIGGWVDPGAGLDNVEKRKFSTPPDLNSNPSVVQPVASCYTNYAIPRTVLLQLSTF
jgi:hypothetical protein